MKIGNLEIGRIMFSSGALGFFGDGYQWHNFMPGMPSGAELTNLFESGTCSFVAKTTTLLPRRGNAVLKEDGVTPEISQECVRVELMKGATLNAWGLSGPGAEALLVSGRWQERKDVFGISFMSVCDTIPRRIQELSEFIKLLALKMRNTKSRYFLEINFSCPNVEHAPTLTDLEKEVEASLNVAGLANIPIVPNLNVMIPAAVAARMARHPHCAAISVANTVKWGSFPNLIPWAKIFGSTISPLARYGGGSLSGAPLLPLTIEWVDKIRSYGMTKPLIAGGGILSESDARRVIGAGADIVKLGTVCILRPHRVRGIIDSVHSIQTSDMRRS